MSNVARFTILTLAVLAAGCTTIRRVADGQKDGKANGKTAGFFFQEENDSIAPGNRDKFYTQGLRWQKTINPEANPEAIVRIGEVLGEKVFKQFSFKTVWSSGIAQTMYTPDDVRIAAPQPFDRPWAGFIYLDNTLRLVEDVDDPHTQLVLELQTGTIGQQSGAHWAQGGLHALIGSPRPAGWGNQLERPIGAELIYLWNRRWGNKYIDFLPFGGGAAGTTMVYANAGAHVRLGWNLSGFFNTGPMQGTFAVGNNERRPTEGFVYVGGSGTFIPYNFFLSQGDIQSKNRVRDWMAGASFRYRSYRLTYNFVRRSREFTHPLGPQFSAHDYGSVVLSYELIIPRAQ